MNDILFFSSIGAYNFRSKVGALFFSYKEQFDCISYYYNGCRCNTWPCYWNLKDAIDRRRVLNSLSRVFRICKCQCRNPRPRREKIRFSRKTRHGATVFSFVSIIIAGEVIPAAQGDLTFSLLSIKSLAMFINYFLQVAVKMHERFASWRLYASIFPRKFE